MLAAPCATQKQNKKMERRSATGRHLQGGLTWIGKTNHVMALGRKKKRTLRRKN